MRAKGKVQADKSPKPSVIPIVRCATALRADHAGAYRVFRGADRAEQRAVMGAHASSEHIAAAAALVTLSGLNLRGKAPDRVELGVLGANGVAGSRDFTQTTPKGRLGLEHFLECYKAPLPSFLLQALTS